MPPLRTREERERDLELQNPADIKTAVSEIGAGESYLILSIENPTRLNSFDFLTRMNVSDFDLTKIQQRYGPGQYRAVFFNEQGTEVRKEQFGIAKLPGTEEKKDTNSSDKIMQMLMERSLSGRDKEPQNQNDTTRDILLPVVLALLNRPQPDPLAMLTGIATIMKGAGKDGSIDPLTMYKELREENERGMKIGQMLGEAGNGENGLMKTAITELGPAVMAIAQGIMSKNGNEKAAAPVAGQPQQIPPANSLPEHLHWLIPLRQYLPFLVDKAKKGKSPVVYADVLIEEMSEENLAKLEESTKADDFVSVLLGAIPEFAAPDMQAWARDFLQELKDHFAEVPEPEKPKVDVQAILADRKSRRPAAGKTEVVVEKQEVSNES